MVFIDPDGTQPTWGETAFGKYMVDMEMMCSNINEWKKQGQQGEHPTVINLHICEILNFLLGKVQTSAAFCHHGV